jgi:hypothetical protein
MTGQVFGNGGVVGIGTMENPSANSAWRSRVAVHTYAVVCLGGGSRWEVEVGRESRGGPGRRWATGPRGRIAQPDFVAFVAEESSLCSF